MKRIIAVIFCLALLALIIGCKPALKESLPSAVSTDIAEISELTEDIDVSELDLLDQDLTELLEGLDI